ncbi:IS66 family transposase [Escherichia coli]|uniref:IS66 family transposase n=1 Tax=Escherichia coli TaxID=562 RepID=UPI0035CC216A
MKRFGSASVHYSASWSEVDNNIAENAPRMRCPGRKNFLFFGSEQVRSGERCCISRSRYKSCNSVDPEGYLHYVFGVIAD